MKCIFCENDLDASTKPEHILLNALGGRMTTREAICSTCNNTFGGSTDKALTDQVPVIRNMLGLKSGTGSLPPGLKNITAGADKISFGSDGTPKLDTPPFVTKELAEGVHDVQILVQSEEELHRILPNLAAKLKVPVDQLKQQIQAGTAAFVEKRPDTVHHRLSFGGPDAIRSMAKSCLVLLATKVGTEPLRSSPFAEIRDFVLKGVDELYKSRVQLDPRELPCGKELESEFGEFFNLIHVEGDDNGRVIGHFTLYNAVGWQIVLAEKDGPRNVKITLVSNPLNPANWSGRIADRITIPFSWLNTIDVSDRFTRAQERFAGMMRRHVDQSREREIGRIVDSVCARYGISNGEAPIDITHLDAIRNETAARIEAHAANVPYEDRLSPARLKELLRIVEPSETDIIE